MTEPPSRRGAERKAELLDATLRIIARDGLAGLSMRGLAAEAGAPLGAVSYYFAGKDELVEAAFARHSEIEGARMAAMISRVGAGTLDEAADAVAHFVVEGCTVRRRQLITEYELMVESARRPALQESTAVWLRSLRGQMVEAMTALGSAVPELDARLLLAVISGLEVDSLADEHSSGDSQPFYEIIRRHLSTRHE
ncbi:transcriptional regulator, TetR family [Klenkia marina]|uniref:Transcriptional regulator, TetR family n=1 Tax=Klenkia marina TaxID=1960309 RepID=A0A1G4XT75_9ACTN|nr:TetR family transcriptional regulator [Klenkia marina]SCX44325.1 transcriptional regulator, TetR family [Klenkia marina]